MLLSRVALQRARGCRQLAVTLSEGLAQAAEVEWVRETLVRSAQLRSGSLNKGATARSEA